MTGKIARTFGTLIVVALAASTVGIAAEPPRRAELKAGESAQDAQKTFMEMMQGPGVTEEGKKAMRDFMQSPKAPQAMNNMMEMARKMGNGDPMLGMTKMMEMMGGQGGMMGGSSGMASPAPAKPAK